MKVIPALATVNTRDDGVTTLHLSDAGGLTHFGCYVETLPPGATRPSGIGIPPRMRRSISSPAPLLWWMTTARMS
jgi:hypothetical protein